MSRHFPFRPPRTRVRRLMSAGLALLVVALAACAPAAGQATPDLVQQAAAEATAIVQQAQATALLLAAQATATAVMARVVAVEATPSPPPVDGGMGGVPGADAAPPPVDGGTGELPGADAATPPVDGGMGGVPGADAGPTPVAVSGQVELLGVGFGAEGGFITVWFRAPSQVTQTWWQGKVSVTDEGNGAVYNEIPVMPVIGPLIGKPVEAGQMGYVMLVNAPPGLRSGAQVTVVLGDYRFEHITVQ